MDLIPRDNLLNKAQDKLTPIENEESNWKVQELL